MTNEKILELLWELKTEDKFYFISYGIDLFSGGSRELSRRNRKIT